MGALEYRPEERLTRDEAEEGLALLAKEAEAILNEKYDGKLETLATLAVRPAARARKSWFRWMEKPG
jgi:hypothetical protein